MARDGSGNYSLPANTLAVSGDPISSTKFNTLVQDLESDANVDRPIAAGGTGASTAAAARTNLGLAIGTDVQAFDAGLLSIAGLTTQADRSIYTTASDTYAVYTLTAAGRAILDDADAAAQRTTLGLAIGTDVQAFDQQLLDIAALAVTDGGFIVGNGTTFVLETGSTAQTSLGYTAADVLTKLLTVDGAGTGLDADLLDGVQPSAFALTILDDADASAVRATIGAGIGDMLKSDNLSGLTNYATARTNLGLAIGTDVQAFDAGLQSISGLTTQADRSIYTTAADTYAVYTLTSAGRALLDDADASAQRTTLGLGTAATVNTGTGGATIPLLNGNNTWSGTQTLSTTTPRLLLIETDASINQSHWQLQANASTLTLSTLDKDGLFGAGVLSVTRSGTTVGTIDLSGTALTFNTGAVWHAGNDGAGSGLDADTLDGVQGSAYATLAGANTFTARQIVDRSAAAAAGNVTIRGGGTGFVRSALTLETADTTRGAGVFIWDDTADVEFFFGLRFNHASADGLSILRRTSVTSGSTDSATADPAVATEIARFSSGGMVARVLAGTETTGTLTVASANRTIQATGDITIPNSVFSAGDIILIYAGASSRTLTQGSGVTMRLGGTATTGSRTLAARGVAMLFFVSASEVVVSGGAVT